eukprot:sb/3467360/
MRETQLKDVKHDTPYQELGKLAKLTTAASVKPLDLWYCDICGYGKAKELIKNSLTPTPIGITFQQLIIFLSCPTEYGKSLQMDKSVMCVVCGQTLLRKNGEKAHDPEPQPVTVSDTIPPVQPVNEIDDKYPEDLMELFNTFSETAICSDVTMVKKYAMLRRLLRIVFTAHGTYDEWKKVLTDEGLPVSIEKVIDYLPSLSAKGRPKTYTGDFGKLLTDDIRTFGCKLELEQGLRDVTEVEELALYLAELSISRIRIIWIWDGAHIIELAFRHARDASETLTRTYTILRDLAGFFKNPTI